MLLIISACMHSQSLSCVQLFVTSWTIAYQPPWSLGFSSQEYWSGLPFPIPGHLPDLGIKPTSLLSPVLTGRFFTTGATWDNELSTMSLVQFSRSVVSDSLQPHGLYSPGNSPSQNTEGDSCSPLRGIFPTQGSNPGLPHYRRILYHLSYQGTPIYIKC